MSLQKERLQVNQILGLEPANQKIKIGGWVRTRRESKGLVFVELNDGSCFGNLQCIIEVSNFPDEKTVKEITTGACVDIIGTLVESPAKGQKVELQVSEIIICGVANPETYPLQKKGQSLEFLRELGHLRVRTNTFGAMFRIRHSATYAINKFFHDRNFFQVHTPIITASDCEGAGEMFRVTTLDLNEIAKSAKVPNYKDDFFGKEAHLTVSGQLNGEMYALSLSKIYTFGPTFRAENSNTSRHLAEFWMVEPEMAFFDIEDNQDLAELFLKEVISFVRKENHQDLLFFQKWYDKELFTKLDKVEKEPFERVTYTQAIEILEQAINQKKVKFEYPVKWGIDMQSEHERYLVEEHFNKPVIVVDYPKEIKAFYMKQNDDGKTVRAMDVLFPQIGEIIGGSQREESLDKLLNIIRDLGLNEKDYDWYLDSRRFGSAPHSGFGLGFERLLLFLTGMHNIRDVIPFPRYPKHAAF